MVWPFDARSKDYAALTQVRSTDLNEVQDRILEIFGDSTKRWFINGISENEAGQTYPKWRLDPNKLGWIAVQTGGGATLGGLVIPMVLPVRTIVTAVTVKYYIASTVGMTAKLYAVTHNAGTAASAPSRAQVGSTHTSSGGTPPDWRAYTWSSLTETIDPETKYLEVEFDNPQTGGDIVAGIMITT